MKMNKVREQISQAFLESLKENELPWKKGWITERPYNAVSNTEYRGVNSFWLSCAAEQKGYSDPRWCTFKQAKDKGWKVKKGEHGTQVEFWSMYDTEMKKKLTIRESNLLKKELGEDFYERVKPISSVYTVFNAEQMEGIPKREKTQEPVKSDELLQKRDTLIRNMEFTFQEGGDRAFYQPGDDSVTLPKMAQFRSVYDYISVFLHESGHATGHESRLNRDLSGGFGSQKYAREELRAEIASAFTSQELGLGEMAAEHMDNHKAYIQSWIEVLEKEPQELFAAIRDAEKISDYLIEKGEFFPEKQQRAELDMQKQQYVTEHQRNLDHVPVERIPVVVNAFGGPGSGKSTACMDICQQLKKLGYNAEYVQEYAKELVYDKNWDLLDGSEVHQFEILKEQVHRMDRLYGQADFIITDSPILLNSIYNQELTAAYSGMVQELHGQYHNFSFFVERDRESFQQEGRIHNLEESIVKDKEIQTLLKNNNIYYGTYTHETIGKVVQNAITTYRWLNQETEKKQSESERSIPVEKDQEGMADSGISFHLLRDIQEIEIRLDVPEKERLTEWSEDKVSLRAKEGISEKLLQERLAYFKRFYTPLYGTAEAAILRLEAKGRPPMLRDSLSYTQDDVEVAKLVLEYQNQGIEVPDIIREKTLEIDSKCHINDVLYTKNIICSIASKERIEYEEFMSCPISVEMTEKTLISVSESLAGRLWDEECSLYTREGNNSHMINSRSELYEAGKEKTLYVQEEEFLGCMRKKFFPTVTCEWSEHECFDDGKTYLVSEFSDKMANADQEWCKNNRGGEENAMGYAKVKFQVNLSAKGDKIVERQDIGDGYGSMIEFLRETGGIQYQRAAEQLEEACMLEKDFLNYQKKLNGIFEQKEGHLPHPEHAMGNCQDEILNTIQKQLNRERSRQGVSKPVNRQLERLK